MADGETPAKGEDEAREKIDQARKESQGADEKKKEGATAEDDPKLGEAGEKALNAFKERARTAEKENKELLAKVQQFEDRDKTEQQKLEERAAQAETRAGEAEAKLMRLMVASAKKLPIDLAERLQGKTQEELEADADRLLTLVKPSDRPTGDVDAGKGEGGEGASFNDILRAKAGMPSS